jgi:hypothetical protein
MYVHFAEKEHGLEFTLMSFLKREKKTGNAFVQETYSTAMKTSHSWAYLLAAELLIKFWNVIIPLSLVKVTGNRISQVVLLCKVPNGELSSVIPRPAKRNNSKVDVVVVISSDGPKVPAPGDQ